MKIAVHLAKRNQRKLENDSAIKTAAKQKVKRLHASEMKGFEIIMSNNIHNCI